MPYKRKSAAKKRVYKKRSPKPSKALVRTIKRVVAKRIETKYDSSQVAFGVNYYNSTINTLNTFVLIPAIAQGVGEGSRIGNIINVTRFNVRFQLFLGLSSLPVLPVFCRVMIGRQKLNPFVNPNLLAGGYGDLFRLGNNPVCPQNNYFDQFLIKNSDNWTIIYDKMFKCGSQVQSAVYASATNNDCSTIFQKTVNISKHVKKLIFSDTGTQPNNNAWYFFIVPITACGTAVSSNTGCGVTCVVSTDCWYKDA